MVKNTRGKFILFLIRKTRKEYFRVANFYKTLNVKVICISMNTIYFGDMFSKSLELEHHLYFQMDK